MAAAESLAPRLRESVVVDEGRRKRCCCILCACSSVAMSPYWSTKSTQRRHISSRSFSARPLAPSTGLAVHLGQAAAGAEGGA